MEKEEKRLQGKRNKVNGARHELKIRKELENDGWFVSKWSNNIDIATKSIVKAKHTFNPFRKVMSLGTGFPDFIAFKRVPTKGYERGYSNEQPIWLDKTNYNYIIRFIECKLNGRLTAEEKEKIIILLELTGITTEIL